MTCSHASCFSIKLETGCLIWAICGIMISSIAAIFSFGVIFYFEYCETPSGDALGHAIGEIFIIIVIFFTCVIIVSFIFTVLLLVGVVKRRTSYLRAYLIFGVVVSSFLLFVFFLLSMIMGHDGPDAFDVFLLNSLIFFLFLGLYSLILRMVHMTYIKFRDESMLQQNSIQHKTIV
ncbi:uncharacterized protein LOC123697332 isoform X2 [Colias croceus]|nr:uncharacterized protein LOC123697332 isoform X2 [Colias croceus]XP_045499764.1 uncharacterized protein LOC123697332 isoform X2 [Colias croceus]XP_045499765.1 uncharacterized protein LOC123697332 isoform X2 [Colias croceus]